MSIPALVLIDGEHYPPVVRDALRQGADRYDFVAALFLGGTEKIERAGLSDRAEELYGLPVVFAAAGGEAAALGRPSIAIDPGWSLTSVTNQC